MSYQPDAQERRDLANSGAVLIAYSIVFSAFIFYGYFNLSHSFGRIAAAIIAFVFTALAWLLARMVGSSKNGIKGALPLFALLLIISAVGVFNSLMVYLEGKTVFIEALDGAERRYASLPNLTKKAAENKAVDELRAQIESMKTTLAQEIRNPRNCGDGPEANKILQDIQRVLPGFTRLSGNSRDCGNNEELIRMYTEQIDKLLYSHPEFINANVVKMEALGKRIENEVPLQQAKLAQLRKDITDGASLFEVARPRLEESTAAYQSLALSLQSAVPAIAGDRDFSPTVDISAVRNLGEWGHLLPLFLSRLDKIQTWVYLALAFFMDWVLVHLFWRVASHRRSLPSGPRKASLPNGNLNTPWGV